MVDSSRTNGTAAPFAAPASKSHGMALVGAALALTTAVQMGCIPDVNLLETSNACEMGVATKNAHDYVFELNITKALIDESDMARNGARRQMLVSQSRGGRRVQAPSAVTDSLPDWLVMHPDTLFSRATLEQYSKEGIALKLRNAKGLRILQRAECTLQIPADKLLTAYNTKAALVLGEAPPEFPDLNSRTKDVVVSSSEHGCPWLTHARFTVDAVYHPTATIEELPIEPSEDYEACDSFTKSNAYDYYMTIHSAELAVEGSAYDEDWTDPYSVVALEWDGWSFSDGGSWATERLFSDVTIGANPDYELRVPDFTLPATENPRLQIDHLTGDNGDHPIRLVVASSHDIIRAAFGIDAGTLGDAEIFADCTLQIGQTDILRSVNNGDELPLRAREGLDCKEGSAFETITVSFTASKKTGTEAEGELTDELGGGTPLQEGGESLTDLCISQERPYPTTPYRCDCSEITYAERCHCVAEECDCAAGDCEAPGGADDDPKVEEENPDNDPITCTPSVDACCTTDPDDCCPDDFQCPDDCTANESLCCSDPDAVCCDEFDTAVCDTGDTGGGDTGGDDTGGGDTGGDDTGGGDTGGGDTGDTGDTGGDGSTCVSDPSVCCDNAAIVCCDEVAPYCEQEDQGGDGLGDGSGGDGGETPPLPPGDPDDDVPGDDVTAPPPGISGCACSGADAESSRGGALLILLALGIAMRRRLRSS